jgi:hypothetical protein
MKPLTLSLATALWVGTAAGAWWLGHRRGTAEATATVIATREGADGPAKPKAPGKGGTAAGVAGTATDAGGARGPDGAPLTLQGILAQVKNLMRSGGMQNPSAMLKTITLLGQIRDEDIQEALKEAGNFKEPQSKMMLNMVLLSRWAEKDGPAALKYAEENLSDQGPMVQMAKMGVLSAWAQSDPDAAWEHLKKDEDSDAGGMFGGRSMMMMGMFSALAAQDADKAFARLGELDDPQERQMALNGIAQTAYDDASRTRLMDEIAKLPDEGERKEARAAILGQLAMMEPDQAIKMTADLPAEERKDVSQRVGTMLMMSDPERGATYLLENAEPDKKGPVYQQIVSQWASSDPNKAGAWLGAQPQTPELDGARSSFATQVTARDPESAMAWANTITEENQRVGTVEQVYNTWKKKDEPAATTALQSSGLSPEKIESIRAGAAKATSTSPAPSDAPAPPSGQ